MHRYWIVLADIGTDWPELFGPYTHYADARGAADELSANRRVFHVEVQALISGDATAAWKDELDEIIEP